MSVEIIGPFSENRVVVDGFQVERLTANEYPDGVTELILDRRYAIDLPADLFPRVAWLVANALAIGGGYSCHGENCTPINPYRVRVMGMDAPEPPEPPTTPAA